MTFQIKNVWLSWLTFKLSIILKTFFLTFSKKPQINPNFIHFLTFLESHEIPDGTRYEVRWYYLDILRCAMAKKFREEVLTNTISAFLYHEQRRSWTMPGSIAMMRAGTYVEKWGIPDRRWYTIARRYGIIITLQVFDLYQVEHWKISYKLI